MAKEVIHITDRAVIEEQNKKYRLTKLEPGYTADHVYGFFRSPYRQAVGETRLTPRELDNDESDETNASLRSILRVPITDDESTYDE